MARPPKPGEVTEAGAPLICADAGKRSKAGKSRLDASVLNKLNGDGIERRTEL
jgi:hypothetical protein